MDGAGDIVYTRRPIPAKRVAAISFVIILGAWCLKHGLTMYAQIPDSQALEQFRAVKSIIAGALLLPVGMFAALSVTLGIFRNLPRLTLSKDKFELQGIFRTTSIAWAEFEPCVLDPKGTFIRSAIVGTDAASGRKIPRPIVIPGMNGDMAALALDLNHRIAAARGEDCARITATVAEPQVSENLCYQKRKTGSAARRWYYYVRMIVVVFLIGVAIINIAKLAKGIF